MDGQHSKGLSAGHLVALVCAAQVMVQIGAFFWPALMPGMIALWGLSNSQAGWITAIFYAAYIVGRAGAGHADRPLRRQADLPHRRGDDGCGARAVCAPGGRLLV